ncbi:hypothetical protein ACN4EK_26460 [Pantanalinema rosaneae CENA516]|uniref:hypothetical protein n=1 Tax=Pantanalinema rosaneae TaxID=1620701 RepID=UPI003D6F5B59
MNPQNLNDDELRRREQELQERERALRLRELEAEIIQPPISPTVKHEPSERGVRQRFRQIQNVATFVGLVIVVAVAVKMASQIAMFLMVGVIAWVAYMLFFKGNRAKR